MPKEVKTKHMYQVLHQIRFDIAASGPPLIVVVSTLAFASSLLYVDALANYLRAFQPCRVLLHIVVENDVEIVGQGF